MARPFFPHEADDPDLDWLVSNFLCERPDFFPVESGSQPLVLLPVCEEPGAGIIATPQRPPSQLPAKQKSDDLTRPKPK